MTERGRKLSSIMCRSVSVIFLRKFYLSALYRIDKDLETLLVGVGKECHFMRLGLCGELNNLGAEKRRVEDRVGNNQHFATS